MLTRDPLSTQTFVLHHINYSNSSKILYCLTKDYGLVHLLAKGARNKKSPLFADCQPFRLIDIQFIKKSGLSLLTSSKTISLIQFDEIKKQFSGFYINELLYKLIKENSADKSLFVLYLKTMDELLDEDKVEPVLREFELKLLANLGYDFSSYIENSNFEVGNYQIDLQNMQFNKTEQEQGFDIFNADFINCLSAKKTIDYQKNAKNLKRFCRIVFNFLLDGKEIKSRTLFTQLK